MLLSRTASACRLLEKQTTYSNSKACLFSLIHSFQLLISSAHVCGCESQHSLVQPKTSYTALSDVQRLHSKNSSQALSPAEVLPESVRALLQDGGSCCMITACHTALHVGSPLQHSGFEPAVVRHLRDEDPLRRPV